MILMWNFRFSARYLVIHWNEMTQLENSNQFRMTWQMSILAKKPFDCGKESNNRPSKRPPKSLTKRNSKCHWTVFCDRSSDSYCCVTVYYIFRNCFISSLNNVSKIELNSNISKRITINLKIISHEFKIKLHKSLIWAHLSLSKRPVQHCLNWYVFEVVH